jgi:hypothetical protein
MPSAQEPPVSVAATMETKELNYEEMDEEHRKLLAVIRESQSDTRAEPRERLLLRAQVCVAAAGAGHESPPLGRVR